MRFLLPIIGDKSSILQGDFSCSFVFPKNAESRSLNIETNMKKSIYFKRTIFLKQ